MAIRARIGLIGWERGLPKEEIDRAAPNADCRTFEEDSAILRLAIDHDINLDWLTMGCLRGLREMRTSRAIPTAAPR